MGATYPVLTFWYFHLPNFILAALMYTLLGRALLGLIVAPDSSNYIWRFFCRITDPFLALIAPLTPRAVAPHTSSRSRAASSTARYVSVVAASRYPSRAGIAGSGLTSMSCSHVCWSPSAMPRRTAER